MKKSKKEKYSSTQEEIEILFQLETTVASASGNNRLELLENLISLGWKEDESLQEWDLYHSDKKLLLAQEVIGDGHWMLKIRLGLRSEYRNSSTMETIVSLAGRC